MLSFEASKSRILDAVPVPAVETVPVRRALGRVVAQDLTVPFDRPDTRQSAVDGYALRLGGSAPFRMAGVVAAGELPEHGLEAGQCAAVMTGGTVPGNADCVVKVEDCEERDGLVSVKIELERGALINEPGSEAAAGAPLLCSGLRIDGARYPALFYAGLPEIEVYRLPRVGILITGDELREVEDGPETGKPFNTNQYILESFFGALGIPCALEKRVPDDEAATRRVLEELAESCDFVVSSGAVSMGRYDYLKKIFRGPDFSLLIEGTAIKPGKPLMVAEKDGTLFFGMPGYPAAFLTNALLYLVPALKKAAGRSDFEHRFFYVTLAAPMRSRKGRLDINRARLETRDGEWTASDPGSQQTSHFLNFANVNGLVFLPETVGAVPAGARLEALHFDLELA